LVIPLGDRIVTIKLDPETIDKIDQLAQKYGLTRSAVIRLAIRKLLEEGAKIEK